MITLVEGVPGSGKTYYAVHHIFKFSPDDQSKLLHNIDGLEIGTSIHEFCKENGITPLDLFRNSFHENDERFHGYTFVIDECQKLFPKRFNDRDILEFFQLHRHYVIDIILLTQGQKLVCPEITIHLEYFYRAVSDTANPLPNMFLYKKIINGEQIGQITLPKKKKVFALYKSANYSKGKEKKKARPMMRIAALGLVAIIAVLFFGYRLISGKRNKNIVSDTIKQDDIRPHVRQNRNNEEESIYSDKPTKYDNSLSDDIGGVLTPVSRLSDYTGQYIILLGVMYKQEYFPYPLLKTRFGVVALLPPDLAQVIDEYNANMVMANNNSEMQNDSMSSYDTF
jgi:hypothetical protein